jgi:hypothetical protein
MIANGCKGQLKGIQIDLIFKQCAFKIKFNNSLGEG